MATHPETLDDRPPAKARKWWRFVERHLPFIVIYLMVATLIGFLVAPNVIITVPSGHVGLLWKRFRGGTQLDARQLKEEGLRILLPWDKLFIYDLRLQTTTDTYNAISKDGVNLTASINIRFRLKHDAVPTLHQGIGPDYISRLVRPEIGNRMREIIAEYSAEEVYSTKRQEIQRRIRTHTQSMLGQSMMERTKEQSEYGEHYRVSLDSMLNLYDTLVLGLELPQTVIAAINRKVEQYYLVQEYAYRVERERKESERKLIEAQGIRAFQQTVVQGISDSYVRWRGIEATLQLAQSNNTKIVIIGSGKDGLPIILGNVDSPVQPPKSGGADGDGASSTTPPSERTPASHMTMPGSLPGERPPAAAARGPDQPASGQPAPGQRPPGQAPAAAGHPPAATTGEQPRSSSWTPTWSDIQDYIAKTLRSSETPTPAARPSPEGPPRPPPENPPRPAAENPPRPAPENPRAAIDHPPPAEGPRPQAEGARPSPEYPRQPAGNPQFAPEYPRSTQSGTQLAPEYPRSPAVDHPRMPPESRR